MEGKEQPRRADAAYSSSVRRLTIGMPELRDAANMSNLWYVCMSRPPVRRHPTAHGSRLIIDKHTR